jgi:hypothetical protein
MWYRYTDVRKLQAAEKKKTPYERRLATALRVFERYQTPEEAEALGNGLLQEAQLRARIATLQQLRRLGARTFAAGEAIQVCPWCGCRCLELTASVLANGTFY